MKWTYFLENNERVAYQLGLGCKYDWRNENLNYFM